MTKYSVVHNNHYSFTETVNHTILEARLRPINTPHQKVEFSQFVVRPLARAERTEQDGFGNYVSYFEIARGLQSFSLSAIHTVTTRPVEDIDLMSSMPWELVAERVMNESEHTAMFTTYNHDSSYLTFNRHLTAYAQASFVPDRPILDAAFDLMHRIHNDFQYDPHATGVDTTAIEAFALQRGVCQDLSHIALACLRSLKLPARYVSGYLDTKITSANPRKYGGDVSHAWFAVYDPDHGWIDFDPTNNVMPGESYITVAYGRDYSDVAPLKGQTDSQCKNSLKVSVDMTTLNK